MCYRSKQIIPGLLRRINELELENKQAYQALDNLELELEKHTEQVSTRITWKVVGTRIACVMMFCMFFGIMCVLLL